MKWRAYDLDADVDRELAALEAGVPGFARQFGLWLGRMAGGDWPPLYDSRLGGWELYDPLQKILPSRAVVHLFVARCDRGDGRGRWLLSAGSGTAGPQARQEAERRLAELVRAFP